MRDAYGQRSLGMNEGSVRRHRDTGHRDIIAVLLRMTVGRIRVIKYTRSILVAGVQSVPIGMR